jgi:maleate cis-trans isomerase
MVQTVIKVRNASAGPIARLQIQETWYDKSGAIVAGGKAGVNGLLQPGEIQTITIETPYNKNMSSNNWNFTHANGAVKPAKVKSLDAPASTTAKAGGKEPAAKPVTAKK